MRAGQAQLLGEWKAEPASGKAALLSVKSSGGTVGTLVGWEAGEEAAPHYLGPEGGHSQRTELGSSGLGLLHTQTFG